MDELNKRKSIEAEFLELKYKLSEKPLRDLIKIQAEYYEIVQEHGKDSYHLIQFWKRKQRKQETLVKLVKWQDKHFLKAYHRFCKVRDQLNEIDKTIGVGA